MTTNKQTTTTIWRRRNNNSNSSRCQGNFFVIIFQFLLKFDVIFQVSSAYDVCVCVCVIPVYICMYVCMLNSALCIVKQFLIKFCIEFHFSLATQKKTSCFTHVRPLSFSGPENYYNTLCVYVCVCIGVCMNSSWTMQNSIDCRRKKYWSDNWVVWQLKSLLKYFPDRQTIVMGEIQLKLFWNAMKIVIIVSNGLQKASLA